VGGLEQVSRPGFACSKAEVLQPDPCERGEYPDNLFAPPSRKAPA